MNPYTNTARYLTDDELRARTTILPGATARQLLRPQARLWHLACVAEAERREGERRNAR